MCTVLIILSVLSLGRHWWVPEDSNNLWSWFNLYQCKRNTWLCLFGWIQCNRSSVTTRPVQPLPRCFCCIFVLHKLRPKKILEIFNNDLFTIWRVERTALSSLLDIDECLENPCGDDGSCYNNQGSFECVCYAGYHLIADATPLCQGLYIML